MFRQALRILRSPLLALALLAFVPALHAQNVPKVTDVVLTNTGPQTVSESLIRANIRVKVGDPYLRTAVDDDVRNLYATGYFLNIRVAEERSADGVKLIYILQGRPKITDILFSGNKKHKRSKLLKKVTSKVGEPMDERKLFADAQAIKKVYEKSGYPKTEVEYVPNIDEKAGRGAVTFEIVENPKVRVEDVHFEGATAFSQRKLRKVAKTRRHWMFSWITRSGVLKEDVLEDDRDRLAEFYRDHGYIDFELADVATVQLTPRKIELRFILHEGKRYKVGAIGFTGVTLFSTNDIGAKLRMKVGEIFTPKGLQRDVDVIQDYYGGRGYIDARIFARKQPNIETGTMDLVYEVFEGDKSFIEKIEIRGNVKTKDRVIRRELAVAPGEVFDMVKVKLSRDRLEGLNYFERVDAQPEPTDVPNRRNLEIGVTEKNTGNFAIGAGFSSVNSIVGFVELSQGNFDLFNPPYFMGGGQKARLRATLGTELQDYQITFIEPWFLEKKLQLSVDLYHRDFNFVSINDTYSERRTGGRIGLTRALGSDFLIGGISYTLESVGVELDDDLHGPIFLNPNDPTNPGPINVPRNASDDILLEEGDRLVSKMGASLVYDTRNNALLPNKGHRTELRGEIAGGPLGADTDFYRIELRHAHYFPGFLEGHIIELAGRTGVAEAYAGSDRVPLFDRFFLGGIGDLRGFKYRQVGPKDEFEEPIGGSTYWFGSFEYSVPIIERLRFAMFYDIGMVYRDAYSFTVKGFDTGTYNDNWGVGIRLNLPIGPLALDYGIPITADSENDSSGRFQFRVGYTREF